MTIRTRRPLLFAALLIGAPCFAQADAVADSPPAKAKPKAEVSQGAHPALPVLPKLGNQRALEGYVLPAQRFTIKLGPAKRNKRYSEREVAFPSPVTTSWPTITGKYFAPHAASAKKRAPAAVVVHHLGGGFQAEEILARHLANNGIAAFTISLPNYGKRREKGTKQGFLQSSGGDPMAALRGFQQAVKDVIRAGDFLRSRPEVNKRRVGLVGVSLGSFVSSVARGVDPRFRRTVLLLGGGNLMAMLEKLPQAGKVLKQLGGGGDMESLKAMIKPFVDPVDPITFAARVLPQDILMFNALKDEIVPRSSTDALWRAFGKPTIHWFDVDHVGIVRHLDQVIKHTTKHLKGRSPI